MVFCGGCGAKSQPERAEEMRLVTALFADLSGFTTLADTLAVEDLHDVIRPLVAGLARIAERYGGFIEKYAGDALLVVFGAPVTHEDDAQRALLAALEMHATLPTLLAELGPDAAHLTIHIGVNTGRVISGRIGSEGSSDYAVLGDSVILAQRLESACPPGQTYVGASTYELTSEEFAYESVGPLTLKGKLEPVPAYRLLGRSTASSRRPLVGRESEVGAVLDGLGGAVTVLAGEPGAGKTRVLEEVRVRWSGPWLATRCLSYGASLAYWPLAELVRQHAGAVAGHDSGLRRLLGELAGGDPETARREVHDAVVAWLSQHAGAVLAVEDLHWADRSTLALLAEVVRRRVPVTLLVTTRPEGVDAARTLSADAATVVTVGPLDAAGVAGVAASVLGGSVAPGLLALLQERARANALHVTELARALSESGTLVRTVEGWDLRPGADLAAVPSGIERVYAARLDALAPPAVALLQLASVIGRTVPLDLLRAVDETADLDTVLPVLLDAGMLEPAADGRVAFSHALLQDVVYGRLLRKRRRELHRRVAETAVRMYGDADDVVGLLARHLYLADAREQAVEPLLRAGRRAASLYAHDEAAVHLERALEVLGPADPRRPAVTLELATAQELRGAYDEAQALYEAVTSQTDDAVAWTGLLAVLRARGEYDAVLEQLPDLLKRFSPRHTAALGVWREGANTLTAVGRVSDAVSLLRTALRLLPPAERVWRGQLLAQLANVESELNLHADATRNADEAVALLDEHGSLRHLVRALRIAGGAWIFNGDSAAARLRLQRGAQVAERTGQLEEAAACLLNLGMCDLETDPAAASDSFRAALARFERLGLRSGEVQAHGNLADALLRTGDLDQADTHARHALDLASRIGHRPTYGDATLTRARIQLARGDSAAVDTAEHAAQVFQEFDDHEEAVQALAVAEQAARAAGDEQRARALNARARQVTLLQM
jgi:adenylate cyclase